MEKIFKLFDPPIPIPFSDIQAVIISTVTGYSQKVTFYSLAISSRTSFSVSEKMLTALSQVANMT